MSTKAVIYARVSKDDRKNEGRNLQSQLEMGREYALKRGYEIIAEITEDDRGASGVVFDLPGLKQVLEMAEENKFEVLVVREIDRLSRSLAKQLFVEKELTRSGVSIEYVLGEYPDNPEGNLMKHVKAAVAEYEREKISQRNRRGRHNVVKRGGIMLHGNPPPYGYQMSEDGKTIVPDEEQAEIVRSIFQWYVEGDETGKRLSSVKIANKLSEQKIPTWRDLHDNSGIRKKSGYAEWAADTVLKILHGEVYIGKWHYGKANYRNGKNPKETWLPLDVPPLVDKDVWETAQAMCKQNKIMGGNSTGYDYLLRFRLRCQHCQHKVGALTVKESGKKYPYYVCFKRMNQYTRPGNGCDLPYFRGDYVDSIVWSWIREEVADVEKLRQKLYVYQQERELINAPLMKRLSTIDELLEKNRRKKARLLELYLDSDLFSKDDLVTEEMMLRKVIADLEAERSKLLAQINVAAFRDEQIEEIVAFATEIAEEIDVIDIEHDFESRRKVIEWLNVEGFLEAQGEEQVIHLTCVLGPKTLRVVQPGINTWRI